MSFASCPIMDASKVALAVAIIKNKPAGMSGRAYAEALACKLKSQDESWKKKAQGLQQEVLRLRQEMLITKVTSNAKSNTEAGGRPSFIMDDASQDLFGPGSEVYSAEADCGSETPDLLQLPPDPAIPLPAPPPHSSSFHESPQGDTLFPHVKFLQSLCALHRVEGNNNRGLEALWFSPDGDAGCVLMDTVCQLLESVVVACKDPRALGPRDLVLQACQTAARAMDLYCSQRLPSVEFMRRVEEPLKELTQMLLHRNQPSGVSDGIYGEHKIFLNYFSDGCHLELEIISSIRAFQLKGEMDKKKQNCIRLDKFPVDQYQNSCHLFWILEALLQKSKVACRVEVGSEQMVFLSHLEQRVFLLSDEFPLFSIYMWMIGGLLTSLERNDAPK
uniref:Meiosis-specific, MEI4 homolog (S. cerevisiae) n=1 Tax=Acanthochromis polyacanthus TaxID=80966 RepID=A0A3Q1G9N2_9TELE